MEKQYLTIDEIAETFNASKTTIARWWKAGNIPPPIRIGRRLLRWRRETVEKFLDDLEQAAEEKEREESDTHV